jgi:hypothetical protein
MGIAQSLSFRGRFEMKTLFGVILIVAGIVLHGLVLSLSWNWFVTPHLVMPEMRLLVAMGIVACVAIFSNPDYIKRLSYSEDQQLLQGFFANVLSPVIALAICWILSWFL